MSRRSWWLFSIFCLLICTYKSWFPVIWCRWEEYFRDEYVSNSPDKNYNNKLFRQVFSLISIYFVVLTSNSAIQQIRVTILSHFILSSVLPLYYHIIQYSEILATYRQCSTEDRFMVSDLKRHPRLRFLYSEIPASHFRCVRYAWVSRLPFPCGLPISSGGRSTCASPGAIFSWGGGWSVGGSVECEWASVASCVVWVLA